MKQTIENLLNQALDQLITDGLIETKPALQITRTKDAAHGDFTCNVAMMLAKPAGKPPREVAQAIIDAFDLRIHQAPGSADIDSLGHVLNQTQPKT